MTTGDGGSDYGLVCPFLTDDPAFACGVEFGLLYARMRRQDEGHGAAAIADYFIRANQEKVLLLANRLGWSVLAVESGDDADWFWCEMERPCRG